MKRMRILLVEESAALNALVHRIREAGFRAGWLRTGEDPLVEQLRRHATDENALRSVWLTAQGSVSLKPRSGPARLRDLLREHFLGCDVVLVPGWSGKGDVHGPSPSQEWLEECGQEVVVLNFDDDAAEAPWEARSLDGQVLLKVDAERLCRALARPRWLPSAPACGKAP